MWNAIMIWTRVVVSISYDDNHYTTGTSTGFMACQPFRLFNAKSIFMFNIFIEIVALLSRYEGVHCYEVCVCVCVWERERESL